MKTKSVLSIIIWIAGFMLLFSSIGISGPPVQMKKIVNQPPAQSPAVQESQIPKPVKKVYSIDIESISMTSQCQFKFKLKNTGADLTDNQHRNCSVKVGQDQNPGMSLATFDPGGRLKKKGETITYLENTPLTEDTNVFVEVTLFNGTQTSKQKLLQPTCPDPKKVLSQAETAQPLEITENPNALTGQKIPTQQKTLQQTPAVPGAYEIKLPDLTVKLELAIGKHNYPDKGMICNTVDGNYTVTNIGNAPSGEYWINIRFKDENWDWHDFGAYPLPSLMPGESKTGNCGIRLRKCPNDEITVGFNVTVDCKHEIKESNENNNTDEKVYPSIGQIKKIPREMKKLN